MMLWKDSMSTTKTGLMKAIWEAVADLAIAQNPYSGDFLVRKAELLFNRKDYQASLELLDKTVVFDATNLDIYLLRSEIMG